MRLLLCGNLQYDGRGVHRLVIQHAEIPAFDYFLFAERIGLHTQIGQGQYHATMVEHRAPRVNDKYLAELFGIHLVGMADDKNIMFKTRQGHGPFVYSVLPGLALLVEQFNAAIGPIMLCQYFSHLIEQYSKQAMIIVM